MLILLYQETGTLRWSTVRERLWLTAPRSPRTGEPRRRLWGWIVPLFLVTALFELPVSRILNSVWASLFPSLAEPEGYSLAARFDTPEAREQIVGA